MEVKPIEKELARYRHMARQGNVTAQNYVRDVGALLEELTRLDNELFRRNAECALLTSRLNLLEEPK